MHSDGRARSDRRQALPGVTWSISALRPEPWTPRSLAGFLRHTRFLLLLFCSSFLLIFNKVGTVVFDKMECAEL